MGRPLTRSSKPTAVQGQRHSDGLNNHNQTHDLRQPPTLNTRSKRPASAGGGNNDRSVEDGRGGRNDAENGFAQWGGYMAAKKQKLDEQFNESGLGSRRGNQVPTKQLFKGDSVHINGYTNPPEPELRELFTRHGGRYVQYPTADTTFVVATNLSAAKKRMFATRTVKPEWITDSIKAGKRLDPRKYMLYDLNKENKQQTLTQTIKQPTNVKAKLSPSPAPAPPAPTTTTTNNIRISRELKQFNIKNLVIKVQRVNANSISLSKSRSHTPKAGPSPSPSPCFVGNSDSSGLGDSHVDSQLIDAAIDLPTPQTKMDPDPHPELVNRDKLDNGQLGHESDDSDDVTIIESTPSPRSSPRVSEKSSLREPASRNASSPSPTRASTRSEDTAAAATKTSGNVEIPAPAAASRTPASTADAHTGSGKMKTASEPGFLQDFYGKSRLHVIATLKKARQQNVGEWRANMASHKFPLADKYRRLVQEEDGWGHGPPDVGMPVQTNENVLFHIDLDCFFVAVARLSRPQLLNKPVVITHSKGTESKSDIACASYEARAFGISAGMWLYQAKELCPDVVAIPYDFHEYMRVSKQFYETVAGLTLEMEAISCDEMLVNVSDLLQPKPPDDGISSNPHRLAQFLIDEIQASAGIKASIGIGTNRLLAKLATRVAKDNKSGWYFMKVAEAQEYIRPLPVRKLHGVGWATAQKLEMLGVTTGSDLERLSLQELKREFGDKTGQKLHSICRGIDVGSINVDGAKSKSISAGCSFGVRLGNMAECERFLKEVAEEAASRAATARCYCNKMTLTLWIARKGYEKETVKPGGHGIADTQTRSQAFKQKTRDASVLASSTLELARGIMRGVVPPEHVRGVSISLDGLIYDDDLSEKERKSHQPTLLSQVKKIQAITTKPVAEETRSTSSSASPTVPEFSSAPIPGPSKSSSSSSPSPSSPSSPNSETGGKANQANARAKPCPKSRSSSARVRASVNVGMDSSPTKSTASTSTSMSNSLNPYSDIQELDPSYLAALPADVRAEVELEFQKARNLKAGLPTPGGSGPSSSKGLKPKSSPVRSFLKRSPIRGGKKVSVSPRKSGPQALKFFPRKQSSGSGGGGSSSGNNLYSYFKAVERAKTRSPSVSPVKRGGGVKTSTQKPGGLDPASASSLSLSSEENRLLPSSSAEVVLVPESPEPELDKELQTLLETTPIKKSTLEVEKMILSFNEETSEGNSNSNGNGGSKKAGPGGGASTDNEFGQRLLQSSRLPKSRLSLDLDLRKASSGEATDPGGSSSKSPRPTTSSSSRAVERERVRNDSGGDDPEVQAAILKSYAQANGGLDDGYDFEADSSFTGVAAGPGPSTGVGGVDDNLSIANNLDSDRDDDFDEYDLNPGTTFHDQEIELPTLNGEFEIDKVHETIRRGITDRLPSEDDAECLMTYFKDLSVMFLAQTCNSLRFLQALRGELTTKGGQGAAEWSSIFDTIINQTQEWIQEDYGGLFEV